MAAFAYRAHLEDGSPETGTIEASDHRDASRRLIQAKKRPFELVEIGGNGRTRSIVEDAKQASASGRRINLTKFLSELSVLLDAGFDIAAALCIMASAERSKPQRTRLLDVSGEIASGRSFSDAIGTLPGIPPEMTALIASGESSGRIADVVARMAEAYQHQTARRAAIVEALIYPAFLALMMVAAFLFLSLFLMPAIEPVFESGAAEKPLIVWLLSGVGAFLTNHALAFATAILGSVALFLLLARRPVFQTLASRITSKLPLFGRLRRDAIVARYLETLSLLTGNSVALIDSLRLAALTCPDPVLREALQSIRVSVSNGESLQAGMGKTGTFDSPTLTLIGIGEESNRLPILLKRAASIIETRVRRTIDRFVTFLTPAVTIALGLMIGTLVVSVMTALLSINELAIQ